MHHEKGTFEDQSMAGRGEADGAIEARGRRIRWVAGAAALVVVIVAVVMVAAGAVRASSQKPRAVTTAQASAKQVSAVGAVEDCGASGVFAPVEGTVKRILVEDQQVVRRGDELVVLDDEPFEVARAQAFAMVRQAEAELGSLDKNAPSDEELDGARSAVKAASKRRSAARAALREAEERGAQGAELSGARADSAAADAGLKQARAALARLRDASDTSRERAAAKAALEAGRLAYSRAKRDLGRLAVRAPADGVVFLTPEGAPQNGLRELVSGQGVSPAAPLLRVVDTSALRFVADVDQDDIGQVRPGQKVVVSLDALPDRTIDATVTFVSIDSRTSRSGARVFRVEAELPARSDDIRLGMEGTAGIAIGGSISAVRIPQTAVVRRDGTAVVFVVSGGVVRLRKVTLGAAIGSDYEVASGVRSGETVVASGLAELTDGARVVTE